MWKENPKVWSLVELGTRQAQSNTDESKIKFQFPNWNPQLIVRSLDVLLDGDLSTEDHVNFQSISAEVTFVHSLSLTRLD